MSQYSRVKKYENQHTSVVHKEDEEKAVQSALQDFDQVSNKNKSTFYEPSHKKQEGTIQPVEDTGDFKNEYIDSFLQEVRDYNMKQGLRENEDTRLDILQQLSAKQREKRASYIEDKPIQQPKSTMDEQSEATVEEELEVLSFGEVNEPQISDIDTTREIALQVQQLLEAESLHANQNKDIQDDTSAKIEPIVQYKDDYGSDRILEETMKLKTQLDEYEEELTLLNDGVDKNNQLLNIIIAFLIFMLLAVISVIVVWLFKGGIL